MESDIKLDKIDAGENYEEHPQDDDIEEIGKHVTDLCEALVPDNSRFSKERFLDILLYFIEDDKRILYSQVTNFIFGSYKKSGSLKEASGIIDNMTTNLVSMIEWTKSDGFKGTSNFQELFKGDSGKLLKLRKVLVKL